MDTTSNPPQLEQQLRLRVVDDLIVMCRCRDESAIGTNLCNLNELIVERRRGRLIRRGLESRGIRRREGKLESVLVKTAVSFCLSVSGITSIYLGSVKMALKAPPDRKLPQHGECLVGTTAFRSIRYCDVEVDV